MSRYLVTGGAGFIGSNFVRYLVEKYPQSKVINLDKLTYAGNKDNLVDIECNPNYHFVQVDIADNEKVFEVFETFKPDFIVNFAAESHNDRSVLNPKIFLETNVLGTQNLLEACRKFKVERFHHISTDEVFGSLELDDDFSWDEDFSYQPRTPYSASKAAADHVVKAYFHTYDVPITISNCCNNYGPYQYPEKLIPLFVTNALENKPLPLFKSSKNTREWIHVLDHCAAIDLILQKGKLGETYNVGTSVEKSVEEITSLILSGLNKPDSLKKYVEDRASHDKRYLLDSSKIKNELGWKPEFDFAEGMKKTIKWYLDNPWWWKKIKSGEFQEYYKSYYDKLEIKDGQQNI